MFIEVQRTRQEVVVSAIHHPNVFGHFMSEPNWKHIPGIQNYEKRVLHVAPLQGKSIFLLSSMPPDSYLQYRRTHLGYGNENLHEYFIVPRARGRHLGEKLLADQPTLDHLMSLANPANAHFDVFIVSDFEEIFARETGYRILGRASNERNGRKSNFRTIAKQIGVNIADGEEFLQDVKEVIDASRLLFRKGANQVVMKEDKGASSTENFKFDRSVGWQDKVKLFYDEIQFHSGVVEEWLEGVAVSPSIHFLVNGKVVPLPGPWEQILVGDIRMYGGAIYPARIPAYNKAQMFEEGLEFANEYNRLNHQGDIGFDTVIVPGQGKHHLTWIEANARKGGVTFIREFARVQKVLDKVIYGIDIEHKNLINMPFSKLLEICEGILFDQQNKKGIAFYNPGLLNVDKDAEYEGGKIQCVIVADSFAQAERFLDELLIRITTCAKQ